MFLTHCTCAHDCTQRPRDPACAPDHLADIVRGDVEAQHESVLALFRLDANLIGLVDELTREIGEQLSQRSPCS